MIYLDNAATTLIKPPAVADAVVCALQTFGNTSRGLHSGSMNASHTVFGTRVKLAKMFNCKRADHVVFTSNVTLALNIAINGTVSYGDHVISTDLEHNSVLRPLYKLQCEKNVKLDFVASDMRGNIDYDEFERLIRPDTKAIVCTHSSNLTGNITDIKRIAQTARKHNVLMIVDAAQTGGFQKIDMQDLMIDILCFTGHKGFKIEPLYVGGSGVGTYSKSQPERLPTLLEAGTLNSHGIAGLSAALDFINETGIENIEKKETMLTDMFYNGVTGIDNITVYGDFERKHAPIVALNILNADSSEVADILNRDYDIAVRAGAHCAPRMHAALKTKEQGAVRFSFSFFNTEEEIYKAVDAIREIAKEYA